MWKCSHVLTYPSAHWEVATVVQYIDWECTNFNSKHRGGGSEDLNFNFFIFGDTIINNIMSVLISIIIKAHLNIQKLEQFSKKKKIEHNIIIISTFYIMYILLIYLANPASNSITDCTCGNGTGWHHRRWNNLKRPHHRRTTQTSWYVHFRGETFT